LDIPYFDECETFGPKRNQVIPFIVKSAHNEVIIEKSRERMDEN